MSKLKINDEVSWRGSYGSDAPKTAKVIGIEVNCVKKSGIEVRSVNWNKVDNRSVIVTLDNGHWAYGTQIKPIN